MPHPASRQIETPLTLPTNDNGSNVRVRRVATLGDLTELANASCTPTRSVNEGVGRLRPRSHFGLVGAGQHFANALLAALVLTLGFAGTDGARLRQILINLLGNAKKFTPAGGVRMIARGERKTLPAKLVIDVIDTGVGIPQDKQNQIFEPFMQADTSVTRKFGGTGLGLSISRRLARLMGGDLTVESSPGAGSNFCLSIATDDLTQTRFVAPSAVGNVIPVRQARQRPAAEVQTLTGLRVLLVDDGDSNRKLVSMILRRAGAEISAASDGQQACDLALSERAFDVILLDMQMPVMDGYTAATRMRAAGLTLPIIALTAHAMKGDRERCLAAGCSNYLTKPISTEELLARIESLNVIGAKRTPSVKSSPSGGSLIKPQWDDTPIHSELPVEEPELAAIVAEFVPALKRKVADLAEVVARRDPAETLVAAHWIKGAAGTAGYNGFTDPAAQICKAIRSSTWAGLDDHVLTLQNYAKRVVAPVVECRRTDRSLLRMSRIQLFA